MNKYRIYSLIGKILSLDVRPNHRELIIPELQRSDISWERFVALADFHLVLQVLYPKIKDHELKEYFPEEMVDHLKYIFELTTARNLDIIRQTGKLTAVLSKEGIIPLFMKGVGNILDDLYKYPGERLLHDIDILIPEEKFENAAGVLIRDGYQSNYKYDPLNKNRIKHYPILYKTGEPVYVELHRIPVGYKYSKFFNTEMVMGSGKNPVTRSDCFVMSDEHKIIHNFLHAQMEHQAHLYAREYIRNLYDLLLLSDRADLEKVLGDFGHFRREFFGYLDITYLTFAITPVQRKNTGLVPNTYLCRYYINLRFRFIEITSLILIRLFSGYIIKPLWAITDKELRRKLLNQLGDPEWYKKQAGYYKRLFGIRKKVSNSGGKKNISQRRKGAKVLGKKEL